MAVSLITFVYVLMFKCSCFPSVFGNRYSFVFIVLFNLINVFLAIILKVQ